MDSELKTQEIRRPAWAGQFYPAAPTALARNIADLFARAPKPDAAGDVVGLVAPHAGYVYSGQVAASSYKLLEGCRYDTVIVVAPSHTKYFGGVSIYNGGSYETPLGSLPTNVSMAKRIARTAPGTIYLSNMGHTGGVRAEHALEVQLPFLQVVLGEFSLVAAIMGDQEAWRTLGDVLAAAAQEGGVLLVASSDLSHYHPAQTARRLDGAVTAALEKFDPAELARVIKSGRGEACGAGPILSCMHAARILGADRAVVTGYAHSGEVTEDDSEVVGYVGAAFIRSGPRAERAGFASEPAALAPPQLSAQDRAELRRYARQAVVAAVYNTAAPDTQSAPKSLRHRQGAFVSVKVRGELRGCIGNVEPNLPLVDTVVKMAQSAAVRDPRFAPLGAQELGEVEIEVSVLSPLAPCEDPEIIEPGRHGLVIVKGTRSGVLLPQVAAQSGWDRATFLQQVCLKAGLPPEAWRDSASTVYLFEAEVF